ncbi:MAG: FtsX-like permease family protein [Bacteroidota bacterium]
MPLARSSRRYLLRHPWLTALSVLGVALGVAVSVAVDLANASALRAFELSGEAVTGTATHQVVGGPGGVDGALVARLRTEAGVREVAPVVDGNARVTRDPDRVVGVLGIDPFAEASFRPFVGGPGGDLDAGLFLTVPGAALLSEATAAALGVTVGDTLGLQVDGRAEVATVIGLLQPEDDRSASAIQNLLVVDVSSAQEWFGMARGMGDEGLGIGDARSGAEASNPQSPTPGPEAGRLSRIDIILPAGDEAAVEAVRAILPEGTEVRAASTQADALATMTAAFRLNLSALSLLALVVGLFLIYNTVTFAVVQRRRVLGTYRALGVTRGEVFRAVLAEAAVVGLVGTAIGVALGVLLGSGLVRLVTQTIGDLYFVVRVRELALSPVALGKGVVLGLGATLLGAARPGWEAAAVAPVQYTLIVWGTLYGYLIFGDVPDAATFLGALIIVLSGLYSVHLERQHR